MAFMLKRAIARYELVHHEDHDPFNNDPENLKLTTYAEHNLLHRHAAKK